MGHDVLNKRHQPRAFTLTEMLVVLGIILILVGLLVPLVMRGRRAAKQTQCMSNLRQIGTLLVQYAERNDDYIPLGTSQFKDPAHVGPGPISPFPWRGWHTRNNQYLWVEGAPSAALGPLLLAKILTAREAKILHCPGEAMDELRWERERDKYEKAMAGQWVQGIVTSYAVRPMRRLWIHDHIAHTVVYPEPMPQLIRNQRVALVAEHPQRPPFSHGQASGLFIHVLYGDGSVKAVPATVFEKPLAVYLTVDAPSPPGYNDPGLSNLAALDESDPNAVSIWQALDRY